MNKKNLTLAVVLAVLVIFSYVYQGPLQNSKNKKQDNLNFLSSLNHDEIDRVEIVKKDGGIELELVDLEWRIKGTKDFWVKEDIKGKIKELSEVDFDLVSKNSTKKGEFQTGETGTVVKLKNGDNVVEEFILGRVGEDYVSSFISKNDINETYSARVAGLNSLLTRDDWYDYSIFSSAKDDVNKIRIQHPTVQYVLEKKDDKWSGTEPYNFWVSEEKVDELVNLMINLSATEIPAQTFEGTGLEKNTLIVQITGENELDNTIMIGDGNGAEEELFYAKRGNSDNIYLISAEERELLDKTIAKLR